MNKTTHAQNKPAASVGWRYLILLLALVLVFSLTPVASTDAALPGPVDTCHAVNFAADGQYVTIAGLPATTTGSTGSLEAWVYPTNTSGAHSIIRRTGSYNLMVLSGNLYAELWPNGAGSGGNTYSTSAGIPVNQWTHVAMTWNGATVILYVNGIPVAAGVGGLGTFPVEDFKIGYSQFAQQFYGTVDEVRVWNDVRDQTEIQNNMDTSLIGNEANLVGLYKFNEASGTTVADSAGGDQNGTLLNGPTWPTSTVPSSVCSPVAPGAGGGDGPGGVGVTDGSSGLEAWYRSDRGVTESLGFVSIWADQSGNGNNASQSTGSAQPVYTTGALNGQPVLNFDGTDDLLNLPDGTVPTGNSAYSVFAMVNQDVLESTGFLGSGGYNTVYPGQGDTNAFRFGGGGEVIHYWWNTGDVWTNASTVSSGVNYALSFVYDNTSGKTIWINGTSQFLNNGPAVTSRNGAAVNNTIGRTCPGCIAGGEFWDGTINEIVIFSSPLNNTERILVENYLSAKYNVTVATDIYDGDDNGNGDFDLDVAGIGQYGGNQHTQAHAAGMIVVNNAFLQDDGDWLLFGHNTAVNSNTSADMPTSGDWVSAPAPLRWTRHFYINLTDANTNGGTVDIIFDFSEGEMNNNGAVPVGPASNYRLLKRVGTTGQFSDIATATTIVGDQVQFLGVDVSLLGSNFTLGTLDAGSSPTAVTLQSIAASTNNNILTLLVMMLVGVGTAVTAFLIRRKQA